MPPTPNPTPNQALHLVATSPETRPGPTDSSASIVEVIRWPVHLHRREELRDAGRLCLFVVDEHDLPPDDLRPSEEWVRSHADPIEVHWRTRRLQQRVWDVDSAPAVANCTLVHRGQRIPVSGADERVLAVLCEHYRVVVPREALRRAEDPPLTEAALSARLHRLRRNLAAAGLILTTVRGHGCALQPAP